MTTHQKLRESYAEQVLGIMDKSYRQLHAANHSKGQLMRKIRSVLPRGKVSRRLAVLDDAALNFRD